MCLHFSGLLGSSQWVRRGCLVFLFVFFVGGVMPKHRRKNGRKPRRHDKVTGKALLARIDVGDDVVLECDQGALRRGYRGPVQEKGSDWLRLAGQYVFASFCSLPKPSHA